MDSDFTPQPVYTALAETLPQQNDVSSQPTWIYDWMRLRPTLFLLSTPILFFALLRWLTPHESDD
jgi:hypothetical protein